MQGYHGQRALKWTCEWQFYLIYLMSYHSLLRRGVSVTMRLSSIDNPAHLLSFIVCQFNIPRCPVRFQTRCLSRTGDSNHSLIGYPGERDLADCAAFAGR